MCYVVIPFRLVPPNMAVVEKRRRTAPLARTQDLPMAPKGTQVVTGSSTKLSGSSAPTERPNTSSYVDREWLLSKRRSHCCIPSDLGEYISQPIREEFRKPPCTGYQNPVFGEFGLKSRDRALSLYMEIGGNHVFKIKSFAY
jgi:hypothetical protein